jgi:Na+/proline symporter
MEVLLPPGARGLMLVGMLAALASTLDTHLNWGASYLTNDLYARTISRGLLRREPRGRELVWIARASSPLLMGLALGVMAVLGSIQEAWHVTLSLGAGLGIPLLLRWLWRRANAWGELAAIVVSGIAAFWMLRSDASETVRLLTIAGAGSAAAIGVSLATRPERVELLDAFYERVRPPGFWETRDARTALARGGIGVLAAAVTLYGSLLGLATWMLGAPAPLGLPNGVFVALCLMLAAACAPVWLRELRRD